MEKLSFSVFEQLLKTAHWQFLIRTSRGVYFIHVEGYSTYNEEGFIARNEAGGQVEIITYKDVLEITIDGKKRFG
jgi:hypothetical protein